MKAWPVLGIAFIEAILCFGHWVIYRTWIEFWGSLGPVATPALKGVLFLLAFSFLAATLLSFSFNNLLVNTFYKLAATWLGFLNFFVMAAFFCWVIWLTSRVFGLHPNRPTLIAILYSLAILTGVYGILNARWIRVRRISVKLPNLPSSWRGRTALMFSDVHLGPVNGLGFIQRIVNLANRLSPDVILLPGDLFDGTKADPHRLTVPFKQLSPEFGIFYSTGNHDEFGHAAVHITTALTNAGVHVLNNQKVIVDGLQIAGVPYHDSTYPIRMRANLEGLRLAPDQPSILLNHVPNRLPIVEQAGFSLQLSGHTHAGQITPTTQLVRLAFGKFTYGLHNFGKLQVYTSSGVGTWGPPMRVVTRAEVVLIQFE